MKAVHSRIVAACLFLALSASLVRADVSDGFYDPDQVRGFISLKGDFRQMRSKGLDGINSMLFDMDWGFARNAAAASRLNGYKRFEENYLGMHVDVGAEYKQFLTWFDIDFMPTQVSKRPASEDAVGNRLFDIQWNSYGANWMFGWKLLPADAPVNLIPSVGAGVSLLNVHMGSLYVIQDIKDSTKYEQTRNRFYSAFGKTVNAELELRLQLGQFSLGGYAGYRLARYDAFNVEGFDVGQQELNGDTWFVGGKLTWTMLSQWQRKQREKL